MCGGGPEKEEATASEVKQSQIAVRDLQHFEENYLPLEFDALADSSVESRDREASILTSRANADVAQSEGEATETNRVNLRSGGDQFAVGAGRIQVAGAQAAVGANQAANTAAQDRMIAKKTETIKTGRGVARSVHSGLSRAADAEVIRQKGKIQSEALRNTRRMQMINDGIAIAGNSYMLNKKNDGAPDYGQKYGSKQYEMPARMDANFGANLRSGPVINA